MLRSLLLKYFYAVRYLTKALSVRIIFIMSNDNTKQRTKTASQRFQEIAMRLPAFTENYLFSGMANKSPLTKENYARDIEFFLDFATNYYPYFPDKTIKQITISDLSQISTLDIDRYIQCMADSGLSERTQARRKTAISVLFDYLVSTEGLLSNNPVSNAQKVEVEQSDFVTYLKMDEQEKLLDCIRNGTGLSNRQLSYHKKYWERDLAIIFLFLDSGLRISELQSLNVNDMVIYENDLDPYENECYMVVLRKGKKASRTPSKVFFSDESKTYIREYLQTRENRGEKFTDNTPLFTTLDGERLSVREIQKMLKKYIQASLGRSDISVHKLRSSFAMEFYKHERDLLVLQQRMGHKSIAATNIYAKASEREEAVRKSRNWRG